MTCRARDAAWSCESPITADANECGLWMRFCNLQQTISINAPLISTLNTTTTVMVVFDTVILPYLYWHNGIRTIGLAKTSVFFDLVPILRCSLPLHWVNTYFWHDGTVQYWLWLAYCFLRAHWKTCEKSEYQVTVN